MNATVDYTSNQQFADILHVHLHSLARAAKVSVARLSKKKTEAATKAAIAEFEALNAAKNSETPVISSEPDEPALVNEDEPALVNEDEPALVNEDEPVKELSKKEQATAIYAEMHADHPRKDIVARFMSEVGLSSPGASTYYQNLKSGKWAS